jgi:hypothetical protein
VSWPLLLEQIQDDVLEVPAAESTPTKGRSETAAEPSSSPGPAVTTPVSLMEGIDNRGRKRPQQGSPQHATHPKRSTGGLSKHERILSDRHPAD